MSLATLAVAFGCNSFVGFYLLPRFASGHEQRLFFRAWTWFDNELPLYGWIPVAAGLLVWDIFVWRSSKPKVKGWVVRQLLTLVLVTGVAPVLPWWVPVSQPSAGFRATLARHPGLPSLFAWGGVVLAVGLLCINAETRDSLLGHGRKLCLVSVGLLTLVLAITLVGWSLT